MNEGPITVRYVKALYQLASESKRLDNIITDINLLISCLLESPEFKLLMETPLVKAERKQSIFRGIFAEHLHDLTLRFLDLLIQNKREIYLKNICHYFLYYHKSKQGIKEAVITTAQPLTPKHRREIFDFISHKFNMAIDLNEKINPDIIGGFILQIEDQRINASLQYQLSKVKRELIQK